MMITWVLGAFLLGYGSSWAWEWKQRQPHSESTMRRRGWRTCGSCMGRGKCNVCEGAGCVNDITHNLAARGAESPPAAPGAL